MIQTNNHGKIKLITRNGPTINLYILMKNKMEFRIPTTLEALGVSSPAEIGQDVELTECGVNVSRQDVERVGVIERVRRKRWIV